MDTTENASENTPGDKLERLYCSHIIKCFQLYDLHSSLQRVSEVFRNSDQYGGVVEVSADESVTDIGSKLEQIINAALKRNFPNRIGSAADAMSVAFLHTCLEDILHSCFLLTYELDPEFWYNEWSSVKIDFSQARTKSSNEIVQLVKDERFVSLFRNQSLLKKIQKLRSICYSRCSKEDQARTERHYAVDEAALISFDRDRQRVVHETTFFESQSNFQQHFDIVMRAGTCFSQWVRIGYQIESSSESLAKTLGRMIATELRS